MRCRALAAGMCDQTAKRTMLEIAEAYERMAAQERAVRIWVQELETNRSGSSRDARCRAA